MKLFLRAVVAFVAISSFLVVSTDVRGDEKVDNPTYTTWSKFKPKTSVKYKNTNKIKVMGNEITSVSDLKMTLVEMTNEKAVVEFETVTTIMGMEFKSPATKQDFPKVIALLPGQKKENVGKPESVFEEGKEKIKVASGEYETKWHKSKVEERVIQSWVSDAIPGSLVKSVTTIGGAQSGTNVMELIEVKIVK